ncbi:MAG: NADH-quinone oxidoreductase subunit G [Rhodospirillaceae bacterium]|jgi:NADH-quinone oxidoreductase subunit G|nr:NADH-quinone oxidoreductase subunit G [Rhodospirillaceae bacterium]MBT5034958.1 NADH-quinone oxidoreductase subunit G [Rhodospirillaceae bacterium]MBT6220307.1 NADH-quinone oxidoreductase subunit G [Rhodospirillaceae bacterium]MBT6361953.1 NADH-quinone oxidoreductase subunit G [Rhodospirillaceae bacterium]
MPKLTIDGIEVEVENGMTVLQACEQIGIEIPRFCYHERLSIAGNCRMCLVEMERAPKPIASCAMPVGEGMVIHTNTPTVEKARKGVLELLLINHPLDCPICDQGGECDLQDQAMGYGKGMSRYAHDKRAVEEKNFGPLVATEMTRCIHCTRCIRFVTEVGGVPELGATGRGENMEVGTYVEKALSSELSGNIIDLCPVGALTNRPYAFGARSWELAKTESVDVMDATGSNIRIDCRGPKVLRILPRLNEDVNEEWISDKTRFACDGLSRQRLDRPYVRENGALKPASWDEAFAAAVSGLKGKKGSEIGAIAGDMADVEAMTSLKDLMAGLGSDNLDCRQDGTALDATVRAGYTFNSTIAGIEDADALLLVGTNPRLESPIINARIRKRYLLGKFPIASVGPNADLTYRHENLGAGPDSLIDNDFIQVLKDAERPMLIVGQGALARADGAAVLAACRKIADETGMVSNDWNGFNVLHTAAARVGGLDIGFVPGEGGLNTAGILAGAANGSVNVVYLLGADEVDTDALKNAFVIYQGHHGDAGAEAADVVFPGAAYTEKNATYVNTEGRVQRTRAATQPPGEAREDWKIIRALSDCLKKSIKFNTLNEVRDRMVEVNSVFGGAIGEVSRAAWGDFGQAGSTDSAPFQSPVTNYYITDPISRASETMADCSREHSAPDQGMPGGRTGTDG